ncbi:MobH family relaxase [Acidomonas methanolica]|uniref:Relaxase/mobilization nuclease n=2 Tax=Acidomonas methanolica TaxID=437 RepID=A0A023D5F5_ACIMT|nr:relaxase/mobilization nuclease [Acidomonas methanolica NBRC 104435]GEK99058.1 helicase [Acidomonas methanolica NBRC 104435]
MPLPASKLLGTPRRQILLEHIWQRTSLSREQFGTLYRAPIERYAELVQQFPASESHHHAYAGGMLDHGLEIIAYALKLRQSHLLPAGATPEAQAAQSEAWTAGIAYAALLHDLGKIAVDLHVEDTGGRIWHPWHGPIQSPYRFRYRKDRDYHLHGAATGLLYTRVLDPALLDWLSGYPELWAALLFVLAGQDERAGMIGELVTKADQASVAQALGGDPAKATTAPKHALQRKLLDGLRYLVRDELKLNQPQASDGWLTQDALWLVSKTVSDKLRAYLLTQGIDGIPANNTAVFNVLQDHGIAQPAADGKAIWKATVTSDAGWSHAFTFLKLSPAVIWSGDERPEPFAGTVKADEGTTEAPSSPATAAPASSVPSSPVADAVSDLLSMMGGVTDPEPEADQDTSTAVEEPTAPDPISSDQTQALVEDDTPSGEHFLHWLGHSIRARRLIINDAKALVHTVAGTVYLVSPGVFQRYVQEHPGVAALAKLERMPDWQWVQKSFERIHAHRKQPSGLNIWTCEVQGPRKTRRIHGYLLNDPDLVIARPFADNPYLTLIDESSPPAKSADLAQEEPN